MVEAVGDQGGGSPVGERLRIAREEKGLTLAEIASQTRIPIRHLEHIEKGEWEALPAPTYSIGFARSYAGMVGLDPAGVGQELRGELGISRHQTASPAASYYEPADPARVPPKSVALIALALIVALVAAYLIWRSQAVGDAEIEPQLTETVAPAAQPQQPQTAQQPAAAATGPVVLTATEDVWLRVYEGGSDATLYIGTLKAGERFEVPATATAPQIRTGRAQSVRVTVGSAVMPPLGPPDRTIAKVSLKAADLTARAGQTAPGAAAPVATPASAPGTPPAPAPAATPED
ncbi:MAG TPA: RodZ domain-containing protein [Allosphingosinicella sp.]|jgi:cytoskeletal protein RodZ